MCTLQVDVSLWAALRLAAVHEEGFAKAQRSLLAGMVSFMIALHALRGDMNFTQVIVETESFHYYVHIINYSRLSGHVAHAFGYVQLPIRLIH